jgi:hypothetical protein
MKRIFSAFLFVIVIALLAACANQQTTPSEPEAPPQATAKQEPTQQSESMVVFSDPLLEKMVRAAMNKPEGDITLAEAETVTKLELGIDWQQDPAPNSQIKDISGLENFKNLENLNLHFHAITDISPLAGLNKLTSLSLGGNPITDITPLAGFTNLGFLTLFGCQAQDYTPLANLTSLGELFLEYSTIGDVSMLSGLTELWRLSLAYTQVSDVSPLSNLTNLKILTLAECPIIDYTPLSGIYANLEEKDFSIVTSLRELGFSPVDNAPQVESYKTNDMYILINRAEWGEMDNKDEVNMVLLCRNQGTDNEITVIYYPNENQFLVLKQPPQDFRYIYDVEGSWEMDIKNGDYKEIETFIEKAYDEVDPYIMLTPIKDFQRTMTNTFGVTAITLFALPREAQAYTPMDIFSAEFNPFGMDWPEIFTVLSASLEKGTPKLEGVNPFRLRISAEGNMFAAVAYLADKSGLSESEKNEMFNGYSKDGFIEFTGTDGRIVTIQQQKPHDEKHENGACFIELLYDVPDANLDKFTDLIRDNYNMKALSSVKDQFNVETDFSECSIEVDLQNKKVDIAVQYYTDQVDSTIQYIEETAKDSLGKWNGIPSAVLPYGLINNTLVFDSRSAAILVIQSSNELNLPLGQYIEPEFSLKKFGFNFNDSGLFTVYEEREPHYLSIAIHRPEWGEFNDWDIELSDTDVNGYVLFMWYHAAEGKWHVSLNTDGDVSYEYYPEGKLNNCYPDPDTVRRIFNDALGTQGNDFYEASLAHFDKYAQKHFGMSIDELYALPVQ